MSENKISELINLYFDGELAKSEEANLFSLLASDQSARNYFKQISLIRNAVDNDTEDFPSELEERILRSVGSKASEKTEIFSKIKIFSAISYAAALILLFLSGYLFFKVSNYQGRVNNLSEQMMMQTKTIQMLYNSLPGVEVRATYDNEIIIKADSNLIPVGKDLFVIPFGCKEEKKIEVIPDYDKIYLAINQLDEPPQLIEGNSNQLVDSVLKTYSKMYPVVDSSKKYPTMDYKFMINETGKVEKVFMGKDNDKMINELVLATVEKWKYKPAVKNGKNVKSQSPMILWFEMNHLIDEDAFAPVVENMPSPIGGMYSIQEKIKYVNIY